VKSETASEIQNWKVRIKLNIRLSLLYFTEGKAFDKTAVKLQTERQALHPNAVVMDRLKGFGFVLTELLMTSTEIYAQYNLSC
jgi:hypothetical protein